MAFSILEWLISESATLAVSKIGSKFSGKSLQSRLDQAVDEWALQLPSNSQVVSLAMYMEIGQVNQNENLPALQVVSKALENNELPTQSMLFDALFERWLSRKSQGANQEFFTIADESARLHIGMLAKSIGAILIQEKNLFNNFVRSNIGKIADDTSDIRRQLSQLRDLISKSERIIRPDAKIFRPIPTCVIPFYDDEKLREHVLWSILKIAFFQTFKHIKYKKFTCLIAVKDDMFEFKEESIQGLTLFCGEIMFLTACERLCSAMIHRPSEFIQIVEDHYDDGDFKHFNLRFQIYPHDQPIPYDIEVDCQTKKFSIYPSNASLEDTYDSITSLNSALSFIGQVMNSPIALIEYDRLKHCPGILKFIYNVMLESKVDFSRFRINAEDFDEWDYEYTVKKDE